MISVNELRIGNWVKAQLDINGGEEYIQVEEISSYDIAHYKGGHVPFRALYPIELTPELLQQCGFIKTDKFRESLSLTIYEGAEDNDTKLVLTWYDNNSIAIHAGEFAYSYYSGYILPNIKHLHELQNLCFDLRGTELEVNPNIGVTFIQGTEPSDKIIKGE